MCIWERVLHLLNTLVSPGVSSTIVCKSDRKMRDTHAMSTGQLHVCQDVRRSTCTTILFSPLHYLYIPVVWCCSVRLTSLLKRRYMYTITCCKYCLQVRGTHARDEPPPFPPPLLCVCVSGCWCDCNRTGCWRESYTQ